MTSYDADIAIIGAGVLGCMAARELSRFKLDIVLLERESDVCEGSSKANSGIIHAGFHPREGSLKGLSCVRGNLLYGDLLPEIGVPFKRTGSLYVAFGPVGMERMEEKFKRGVANGAPGLKIIDGDEARQIEPGLSDKVIAALWAPTTGIVSPFQLTIALYESALANGVDVRFGSEVERIEKAVGGGWLIRLRGGSTLRTRFVLNAAGDEAEPLDAQVHPADLEVRPRRGQYYVFDKQDSAHAITHPVMQSQETDEGGTLVTPTVEGNLLVGPTSENVRDYTRTETTEKGLAHVERVVRKLFPGIDMGQVISSFAGVRTNIVNIDKERKDFVVRASAPGFVSMLGIKNPGMTSAPALVERAVDILAQEGMPRDANPSFISRRETPTTFMNSDDERKKELLCQDGSFAHVVCRCERITEGDVRRVARLRSCPHTFEAVKHRLRVSMGRCQGSFCVPRVMDILAQEWNVRPEDIPYCSAGGSYSIGEAK